MNAKYILVINLFEDMNINNIFYNTRALFSSKKCKIFHIFR